MTRQYNNRGRDQINIETVQGNVVVQKSTRSNAEWTLLQEVDQEVESRLDQSLHNAAFINLGKQSQPEQVKRIWDAEVKIGAKPPEPLLPDVCILDVFERSDISGKLLILGDPGAGKTTTLLDLAQALVNKALQDANYPIPVLINLSGWQEPRQSMPDWLVEELKSKYGVRRDIGKQWLQEKRLLPLLDGLDEVKPEHQEACVQAINQWLESDRRPIYVVVCSRREEYANSQTQLHLNGAILLQALTEEQIQNYLIQVNRADLWQVLQQDAVLLDLMKTPLWLSITTLSYEELSLQKWQQLTSTPQRLTLLLDAYIQTMLHRNLQDLAMLKRGWESKSYRKRKPPTAAQTRYWLTFLAQQLQRESQTEFLIERMQPYCALTHRQKRIYELSIGLFLGLSIGLLVGVSLELISGLILGLIISLSIGLIAGPILGLSGWLDIIEPAETLNWSKQAERALIKGSIIGLVVGLILGLFFGLIVSLFWGLNVGLTSGLFLGITFGLSFGLLGGLSIELAIRLIGSEVEIKREPNQGILKSANNAYTKALSFGLGTGLCTGLFAWLTDELSVALNLGLSDVLRLGLFNGLNLGLLSGLSFGGKACIQHVALRLTLYHNGSIPWHYARFLNYCTERLLLQRVGGRYRFVHKLLQERFAELGNG